MHLEHGLLRIDEDLVNICGKLKVMDQMLEELLKTGHKILIFSQVSRAN
jgi:SNF2 family DNA or RNA helicase